MKKPKNQGPGTGAPPVNHKRNGRRKQEPRPSPSARGSDAAGNDKMIDQIRRIIAETPELRPEKVGPLEEAVEQGTYEVDARKLANILITELILKR
jgi:anti-sigma28 factor (negative regulator of flagellin synthesis)